MQPFRLTRIIIDLEDDFAVDPTDGIYDCESLNKAIFRHCLGSVDSEI